jgi:hypothetical protein
VITRFKVIRRFEKLKKIINQKRKNLERRTVRKKSILEEYEGTCGKKPSQHSKESIFHLMVKMIISNECFMGIEQNFVVKVFVWEKGQKKQQKTEKSSILIKSLMIYELVSDILIGF